jgi:hypothetical protein
MAALSDLASIAIHEGTCDKRCGSVIPSSGLFHIFSRSTSAPPSRGAFSLRLPLPPSSRSVVISPGNTTDLGEGHESIGLGRYFRALSFGLCDWCATTSRQDE